MGSSIDYKSSVSRDLKRLDKPEAVRILKRLEAKLEENPGAGKPLKGDFAGLFSLRMGAWRIIYTKTRRGVLVLRIAHRKDVYK